MDFEQSIQKFIDKSQILKDEPMKKHTSFKIGGNADYFIIVKSLDELQNLIKECKNSNKNYYIIGNGTNLLVTDKGIRGVVIKLKFENIKIDIQNDQGIIEVDSGYSLIKLSKVALENNLEGLEFASRNSRYSWWCN